MIDFYQKDKQEGLNYLETIQIISSLSRLFSENDVPFLHYRVMENLFCSCFNAENLSRSDTAYDAKIGNLGVGLKTFICSRTTSIEKVAEFNKDSQFLKTKTNSKDLAETLSNLRNQRIDLANNLYGINHAIYHIIARKNNQLIFFETDYDKINTSNLRNIKDTKSSLSFYDGNNEYFFNYSKSVLQRKFYIPNKYSTLDIQILNNPFEILLSLKNKILESNAIKPQIIGKDYIILPLFSLKGNKHVPEKSGLNQWNAGGRPRSADEIYIPIPNEIHKICPRFFPDRDTPFILKTPINQELSAKLCQDNSKALMTNPNSALSEWLLRKILMLKENELLTLDKLESLGFDSVIITKENDNLFKIDIMPLNSYEKFITELKN
ncbi:restriction endonuclease [Helicobacter didelphidarum]|uniref:Restriction endonuclease n=1 Tax=Helicobacter didelphidarum TaxID=2040648 RepID=A0A3D8IA57_9HELI|nr:restriction endonuclease [Helicobacter didelphidarum]RDU62063.1 restriction endonuclease [Helicobacter didelphidarum]